MTTTDEHPVISVAVTKEIQKHLFELAEAELEHALNRMPDLSDDGRRVLKQLTYRIVERVLQAPDETIKNASSTRQRQLIAIMHYLFNME